MTPEDDIGSPLQARSDLVDILAFDPDNARIIASIIELELLGMKDRDEVTKLSNAITEVADRASLDPDARDNLLFWLTKTSPDARQMILVKTVEKLLEIDECRPAALKALGRVSSEDNVQLVMDWVERGVLTMNQAIFVLLYPDNAALQ